MRIEQQPQGLLSHQAERFCDVTSGERVVISDGVEARLSPGMAVYLHEGAVVGIGQVGDEPLSIIIAYPLAPQPPPK